MPIDPSNGRGNMDPTTEVKVGNGGEYYSSSSHCINVPMWWLRQLRLLKCCSIKDSMQERNQSHI